MPARALLPLLAALALAVPPPGAFAQTEFRLRPDGAWEPKGEPPPPGSDEAVIREARRLIASDRPGEAEDLLTGWIERNERTRNPLLPQAYLLRGDALLAGTYEYDALHDYEAVIRGYPESDAFLTAVEREVEIGTRYLRGLRRRWLGMRLEGAESIGQELLIRAQERAPKSNLAERAAFELGDYYYRERELKLAAEMYDVIIQNFPESDRLELAMRRRAYASIARFKGPRYNAGGLADAKIYAREYARRFPADAARVGAGDALLARLDESAAAHDLEVARWYLRRSDPVSARYVLRRLMDEHPRTVAAAEAGRIMTDRGWIKPAPPAGIPDAPPPLTGSP